MAYLIIKNNHEVESARAFVTEKRPIVSNHSFLYMLYDLREEVNEELKKYLA